jgi:hypothetical protein
MLVNSQMSEEILINTEDRKVKNIVLFKGFIAQTLDPSLFSFH